MLLVARDLARGRKFLVQSARRFGYPHAQHRLAVAHATGLLGPIPPAGGDAVDGGEGELGDELRSLVLFQFAAAGGDVAAAMALGYRCVFFLCVRVCGC